MAPNITRRRAMRPVVVPAIIAVRRETKSFEFVWELTSVVGTKATVLSVIVAVTSNVVTAGTEVEVG